MKNNRGISLIELLVVVAILIILTVLSFRAFVFFQKESDLTNYTEEIINTLRLARNKTLSSEESSNYGVHFETNKYVLFKGRDYNPSATDNRVYNLSPRMEIYDISLSGGGSDVVFEKILGNTSQSGTVSLRLKNDLTKTNTISISSNGQIAFGIESLPTDEGRIKDTRHVHLTYNNNLQEAVTLHLIFPDYPSDNYDIDFQTYLNPEKTEFFWEGTIFVGPEDNKTEQKLKIHTHNISVDSAQFCVHRDRRYNDKTLQINLDDQNLINYTADGQVTKGSSIYVSEPEIQ